MYRRARAYCILAVCASLSGAAVASGPAAAATDVHANAAKAVLSAKIKRLDHQFSGMVGSATCEAAGPARRSAAHLRSAALSGPATARAVAEMNAALALIRSAQAVCATSATPPDSGSAPEVPGTPPSANERATSFSASVPLESVTGRLGIDLSGTLDSEVLPERISVIDASGLSDPFCAEPGGVCVGIDPGAVADQVQAIIDANPDLLTDHPDLPALVDQVRTSADVSSLLEAQRAGDQLIVLIPSGPLADISADLVSIDDLGGTIAGQVVIILD